MPLLSLRSGKGPEYHYKDFKNPLTSGEVLKPPGPGVLVFR
jgi:hypothetical protein